MQPSINARPMSMPQLTTKGQQPRADIGQLHIKARFSLSKFMSQSSQITHIYNTNFIRPITFLRVPRAFCRHNATNPAIAFIIRTQNGTNYGHSRPRCSWNRLDPHLEIVSAFLVGEEGQRADIVLKLPSLRGSQLRSLPAQQGIGHDGSHVCPAKHTPRDGIEKENSACRHRRRSATNPLQFLELVTVLKMRSESEERLRWDITERSQKGFCPKRSLVLYCIRSVNRFALIIWGSSW